MPTASAGFANAIKAYDSARQGKPLGEDTGRPQNVIANGDEFAGLVRNAIDEAIKIGERSENLSVAAVTDKADINQVVTAVAEAEVTLQTVVAVRDKVLEAYKDIIRMPM